MYRSVSRRHTIKPESSLPIDVGDYVCSERQLFRIEHLERGRCLVEDCRTGDLFHMPLERLLELRRLP